ncbi:hypothetical protein DPMN_156327 [Dreissena polymorpha]|uniref:Uncharacterized protein n=1 Tax=Dreissena polymorpha TaxID=45954 RepID=A0A9D4FS43_DREPO|nr:hypothetical protein DPMN_156327 [Dreissena polymorpha]
MLEAHFPDLQKRVRTLVCKVYGDVDTNVEKTYSCTQDPSFVRRITQMANTLQSLWKVVFSFSNTCSTFRLEKYLEEKSEMSFYSKHLSIHTKETMNTIQQQICDLETRIDVLYNLPLHVLQRNSFDKYIESENKTQSERTETMIKTIKRRLNCLTKHEEEFRNAISTLKDMKAEIESKSKHDEEFQNTMLIKTKQAAEGEDEFRRKVLAQLNEMQDLHRKKADSEHKAN